MALTSIVTKPSLRGTLATLGPWNALFARSGYRVYPYPSGCAVRNPASATNIKTYGMGSFAATHYALACSRTAYGSSYLYVPNQVKVAAVSSIGTSDDELNLGGVGFSVDQYDWLLNLGVDPDYGYDGSSVTLYSDPVGAGGAQANPYLVTGQHGLFEGWVQDSDGPIVDLLITDNSGTPIVVWPSFTLGPGVVS